MHHTLDTRDIAQGRALQIRPLYWLSNGWPVTGEPITESPKSFSSIDHDRIAGVWLHSVDYGDARPLTLTVDGKIVDAKPIGTWTLDGDSITLRFPDETDAEKVWIDRCLLIPEQGFYIGRNQAGSVIRGYWKSP